MPKMNYRSSQGGTASKNSMHSEPAMRMTGDGTKMMNTGHTKAPLRDITWKGTK